MSAPSVHGYTDQPRGEEPRSRSRSRVPAQGDPGGSGFTGTWDAGRRELDGEWISRRDGEWDQDGRRDPTGQQARGERTAAPRTEAWATPADLAARRPQMIREPVQESFVREPLNREPLVQRPPVQEPQPSWGYADDGSWVGAAGAVESPANNEWWEGAAPARNAGWASPPPPPGEDWGPVGDDEPPSTRRRATKVVLAVAVVVALLVVGVAAFAGTILLGGGPGSGGSNAAKADLANGAQNGAPAVPGASDAAGDGYPDVPTPDPTTPGAATPTAAATTHAPAPTKAPTTKAPTVPGGSLANPVQEGAVLGLVNKVRGENGCKSLSFEGKLSNAARKHSLDMATRHYFSHDTPEGVSMADRITAERYNWSMLGENIAEGQKDANAVMTAWMNSPGHRANILNCKYTQIGIGLAFQGKTPVWTQDFGTPQ